jgi:putative membrane protein
MAEPIQLKPSTVTSASHPDNISVELSERRTGLSFQRTRMSADRTLMSVIRTALSLIGFGFTIFQFFRHLQETKLITDGNQPARNFGLALVFLGVGMLAFGIAYHVAFMKGLRHEREELKAAGLIHGESVFPASLTLIVAVFLFLIGLLAIASIAFRIGPFNG